MEGRSLVYTGISEQGCYSGRRGFPSPGKLKARARNGGERGSWCHSSRSPVRLTSLSRLPAGTLNLNLPGVLGPHASHSPGGPLLPNP